MKTIARLALLGSAALVSAMPAYAVDYLPVGAQSGIALSTVTSGGWSLCYSATMGTPFGTSAATTLANCSGDRLMMAGRETGSSNLIVLSQALKVDALFNTGASDNGVFHAANGSDWFYADNYSWGFKSIGSAFTKNQCDFSPPSGLSMCIHTLSGAGGFSINDITNLNGSSGYEKLVFSFVGGGAGAVPEPATWAMMIGGFALVGASMRRRKLAISFA